MSKKIIYGQQARESLQKGIDTLANTVKSHLVLRAEMLFWTESSAHRLLQTTVLQ